MSRLLEAAAAIRTELKAKYPGRKFSVRTQRFSMGNSVDVRCDHDIEREVKKLLEKYQAYKGGDAISDEAIWDENKDNLPQASFVHVTRFDKEDQFNKAWQKGIWK